SKTSHLVEAIASRPWPSGTEFAVISVVDLRHWEGLPALVEDAEHAAKAIVKSASDTLSRSGHKISIETPQGSPKQFIIDYARRWGADLIMVGSHGSSATTRFLLGSVAQSVLQGAPCSVEIVRNGPSKPLGGLKILLATDGSSGSDKAAAAIAA